MAVVENHPLHVGTQEPETMKRIVSISTALVLTMVLAAQYHAGLSQPLPVDKAWLAGQYIKLAGTVAAAKRISDNEGDHVLVLSRRAGPSAEDLDSGLVEDIELKAVFYSRAGAGWKPAWTIYDEVDCPHLDSAADFFPEAVTFTDLNGDGRVETTVSYHMFCNGGIDTHAVKVILREGTTKLAIRGESRMFYPGQAPFGGEHRYDKALLQPDRAAYKRHLDRVGNTVSVFHYR